jgi:hypothetical protein
MNGMFGAYGGLPYQALAGNQLPSVMPLAQNQALPQMLGAGSGDIGFTPMTAPMLAMMGISDPNVMQFRTPQYDQPIMPFGAQPMPVYGYQQQFGTGQPGVQPPALPPGQPAVQPPVPEFNRNPLNNTSGNLLPLNFENMNPFRRAREWASYMGWDQ